MSRGKIWTDDDTAALERAAKSGKLDDGRPATQGRLALVLGFSQWTVHRHLKRLGLSLAGSVEVMREAGGRGGRNTQYSRRLDRVLAMLGKPRTRRA